MIVRLDLSRRTHGELPREFRALVIDDRRGTTGLLARAGEIDARKLFRAGGCPSMLRYCTGRLRMSEDVACERIQVARVARRSPEVSDRIAERRLTVSSVLVPAPWQARRTSQAHSRRSSASSSRRSSPPPTSRAQHGGAPRPAGVTSLPT